MKSGRLLAGAMALCMLDPRVEDGEGPRRVRLFDRMNEAILEPGATQTAPVAAEATTQDLSFRSRRLWRMSETDRGPRYEECAQGESAGQDWRIEGEESLQSLRIGPGTLEDSGAMVLLVPCEPLTFFTLRGQVRLRDNPMAGEASSREVVRIVEVANLISSPGRTPRQMREFSTVHRVARSVEPDGLDRFEYRFLTQARSRTLEIQLLHRTGGSAEATTTFESLVLESRPGTRAEILDDLSGRYRPNDGIAPTPWRMRVRLLLDGLNREEVRDSVLLEAPATLRFPLHLPEASARPELRFHCGMPRELQSLPGDGMVLIVRFDDESGARWFIGAVEIDPRNVEEHRTWREQRMDLSCVAGRKGFLAFSLHDAPETEPDLLDVLALATPRIEPREESSSLYNVLLIGVDTLRADKMSVFGYKKPNTPNLERLAARGVKFSHCRSQAPWTLPSFSSILTSLYPSQHGAGRGGHDEWTPIDPGTVSIAEVLARVGYETQAITANFLVSPTYGLDQGFEAFRNPGGRGWSLESVDIDVPGVVRFLETHRNTPFLLFWHIMDPHLPYVTGEEVRRRFVDAAYRGQFRGDPPEVPFEVLDPRPGRRWFTHEGPPPMPEITDEDRAFIEDYYAAEVAEMDAAVGAVLDALERLKLCERTIVALVADHGEGLGDHQHYHHGYTLFDDQVHIPLILSVPGGRQGVTIDRPVAAIDLVPMILGALRLRIPEFMEGVDRLAADAPVDDPVIIECPTYDSSAEKALVLGDLKYLHDPNFRTEAVYDMRLDPLEMTNALAQHPEFAVKARAALQEFRWKNLQPGRFHLEVRGRAGQRLRLKIGSDDLFDANLISKPLFSDEEFEMDVWRTRLVVDTTLEEEKLELVFWCRGRDMSVEASLEGESLTLQVGESGARVPLPSTIEIAHIPTLAGAGLPVLETGSARLWLEAGASPPMPVTPTPEEIELLRALGYAH